MAEPQNYTLGRGELWFAQFSSDGLEVPGPERYLGNTPSFAFTVSNETLDHYSSDRGVRQKDASVPLQVNRSGSLSTDNVSPKNLALFFFGDATTLTVVGAAGLINNFPNVEIGYGYQLGVSSLNPTGVRKVSAVTVTSIDGLTPYVLNTDYTLDTVLARVTPLVAMADMKVTFTTLSSTRDLVISGSTPISGALRYIAYNPKGKNIDYFFPSVTMTPNGEFPLKTDEWQVIPFSVEILTKSGYEAIYAEGRAL